MSKGNRVHIIKFFVPIGFIMMAFFLSCQNDIEKVNALAMGADVPNMSGKNYQFEYTDTGKLQLRFFAPEANHYMRTEVPMYKFPKGIEVYFYDDNEKVKSIITARYAEYNERTEMFEARDSVVVKNLQSGERVDTEKMFWDRPAKKIYSETFTKITNPDGVFFGNNGFEAAQDLSYYRLIGSSGSMLVKDEEKQPAN